LAIKYNTFGLVLSNVLLGTVGGHAGCDCQDASRHAGAADVIGK